MVEISRFTHKEIKLLPCPFCRSEPKIIYIGNDRTKIRKITIKCSNVVCRIQRTDATLRFGFEWLEEIAINGWNRSEDTILQWVQEHYKPNAVFGDDVLEEWAHEHGMEKVDKP